MAWIWPISQKENQVTRQYILMSPWQNPNERIRSATGLFCLCRLRLPGKAVILPPSSHHVRMNSFFSSITSSVTQSAVTSRQKLIQKHSPINCVQRQFEVLFPFRKTAVSCPNYIISLCISHRCSELLHLLKHSNTSQLVELWMWVIEFPFPVRVTIGKLAHQG